MNTINIQNEYTWNQNEYNRIYYSLTIFFSHCSLINPDRDFMILKGNHTKFIAGELSLKASLILYLPIGHYEP